MKRYYFLFLSMLLLLSCSHRTQDKESSNSSENGEDGELVEEAPDYSEEELLTLIQKDVLKYFWDYAEENSGLARERFDIDDPNRDGNTVTTGGSGFGLMTLLVGIENGMIDYDEAVSRLNHSLDFLKKADRFHGAWSHWIDGNTGNVRSFGDKDDGADLVETAFLVEGLICVREYFKDEDDPAAQEIVKKADALWKSVEWTWFTNGEDVLYWHWSPQHDFGMNHKIQGFDETLITYILAASSPDFSISKKVYDSGWARNGDIKSVSCPYDIPTVVNHNGQKGNVGPMFWSHYSFIGLDPRGLRDEFVDYGEVTQNHAKIMYAYALDNPKDWVGYGEKNWGLTASYTRNEDGSIGYAAHSPQDDRGVIAPTAAFSSIVYLPEESMTDMRFLYEEHPDKYVGEMGPYDAYSTNYDWVAPRYLAIDQGPIAPMIENYKSEFLWNLFMGAPEIQKGLKKLGFSSDRYDF